MLHTSATASLHAGPPALLVAQGLTKRFGPFNAVTALDLTVHAGEIVGLLGPNGAGKTCVGRKVHPKEVHCAAKAARW